MEFRVDDITKPRDLGFLRKPRGTTTLPVLELPNRRILKESLVILGYLEETVSDGPRRRPDPLEHAVESMLIAKEGPFNTAGYVYVMNRNRSARRTHLNQLPGLYRDLDDFLSYHSGGGAFLIEGFGLAEAVFTPNFKRFWFLDYEGSPSCPGGPDTTWSPPGRTPACGTRRRER